MRLLVFVESGRACRLFEALLPRVRRLLLFARAAFDAIEHLSVEATLPWSLHPQIAWSRYVRPTFALLPDEVGLGARRVPLA